MTDFEIKQAVEAELEWDPSIDAAEVAVAANDGIITLSGRIGNYWEKIAAEKAAERVEGVKAVVNEIEVRLSKASERTDEDIAKAAVHALKWSVLVPSNKVKVKVSNAWVTLEGEVDWQFQKSAAEKVIRKLKGIKGISNLIALKSKLSKEEIKEEIESALRRSADIDAENIQVNTDGDKVILRGTVRSWHEREEAERAAWRSPGVKSVEDDITVAA
jgi:osmotically-inducible protein OsmY